MGVIQSSQRLGKSLAVLGIRKVSRGKSTVSIRRKQGVWRVKNTETGEFYDFPLFPQSIHIAHIGNGYSEFLGKKYQLENFVELESGDKVVDIGPYVGAFIRYGEPFASKITAIEPAPDTARLLEARWKSSPKVEIMNMAAWNKSDTLELRFGRDASDNSLINIDKGNEVGTVSVDAIRLDNHFEEIDFLKLEAEGAEPEVLQGLSECSVHKVAIDASPERSGDSTLDPVLSTLGQRGFETRVRGNIVFGRRNSG